MTTRTEPRIRRPSTRRGFEIAIICALTLEADAVDALFDLCWDDDGSPFDKAPGDPNAYSTGAIGRHNVVLAHMPGMGTTNAAIVANNCRISFPNIKLALVVGVCGVVPFTPDGEEIILGDVIVSDAVIQYDLGRQQPDRFVRKDTLLDSLGRPNVEIRAVLAKLKTIRSRKQLGTNMAMYLGTLRNEPLLAAGYPGAAFDRLYEATYRHNGDKESCEQLGCEGKEVLRHRLHIGKDDPQPTVHFGLVASGNSVMKSGEDRDAMAKKEGVIAFEMEGTGVWDTLPCVVIKGACDYADSHKSKAWQRYAAATAAACMKAFLGHWVPSTPAASAPDISAGPYFLVPYPRNEDFVGRDKIFKELQNRLRASSSQPRVALFGLGGIGKTQIAIAYTYWLHETCPEVSVFWVHASSAERFRQAYSAIAQQCRIPGFEDPKEDMLELVKKWLESTRQGHWLMVIDNADDQRVFYPVCDDDSGHIPAQDNTFTRYIPECSHGSILITTRNKQVGVLLAKTRTRDIIHVEKMDQHECDQLVRTVLDGHEVAGDEVALLSTQLGHLPLALIQATAYIQTNSSSISQYLWLLNQSDQNELNLLSREFETVGRDSGTPRAVAATWILSFKQIKDQSTIAGDFLSLMSFFDRQAIPREFLSHYFQKWQPQTDRDMQLEIRPGDIQLEEALGLLKAFSFISADKGNNLIIHRLVQLVTRKWLVSEGAVDQFGTRALITVSDLYPFGEFESHETCNAYLPHALAVLQFGGTGDKLDEDGKGGLAKAALLHNVAGLFLYKGQWKDAEEHQLKAITIRQSMLGKLGADHPDTLTSMGNLASTYRNQGRWDEAEKLAVQVLETRKRKLGADHPGTLTSMGNLASTYRNQGRWDEAEKLEVQVLETRKRKLGADHPSTLAVMNNLAFTWKKIGRHRDALRLIQNCSTLMQRVLGPDHPYTVSTLRTLITWQKESGSLAKEG